MSDSHGAQPGLAHHFETYEQQKESSFLGMWLFLVQEVMFFGGIFVVYVIYRHMYPLAFEYGSQALNWKIGAANTAVLLFSSFTMVVAVFGAQTGKKNLLIGGLILTMLFGGLFLGVKYFEYAEKWEHHLVPGDHFDWQAYIDWAVSAGIEKPAGSASVGSEIEIFFSLYFAMTGMHALHMIIGMGIMVWMIFAAKRDRWTPQNYNFVEGFGLYWHFVDIVWIFLFPFLYLVGANSGGL